MSPTGSAAERPLYHLEDLEPGVRFTTGSVTVTKDDIFAFATSYDPQPFHLDEAAAEAHPVFQGLSASGWQTASLTMRLLTTTAPRLAGGVIGLGGEVKWPRPVRPGDVLTVHAEVAEQRRSQSRPDRGIVTLKCETRTQRDEVVQQLVARLLVFARGAGR
ncbi:MAG: MaoC family dehydratase [Steroidobacteraceae bacterium]